MSTRVHELAKELGLKSPELLDRIQEWGLDVKRSSLASLDAAMAERIRQLAKGSSTPAAVASTPSPSPPETPAIRPTAPAAPRRSPAPPAAPVPTPPASTASAAPAPPSAPASTPAPTAGPASTSAPAPTAAASTSPAAGPAPATPPPLSSHSRSGGLASPPRGGGGGGPLSGHTPHRSGPTVRPGGGGAQQAAQAGLRPNPATPPPLKRSDYLSPAGTRHPVVGGRPVSGPGMGRRPGDSPSAGQGGEGPRRESTPLGGTRRPLPPVAAPTAQPMPPRRPDGPRPGAPELKTQRPEMKFTREQLLAMKESGQLGGMAPSTAGRPGQGPRPGMAPRGPIGPGLRRPPTGPVAATPAPPPPTVDDEEERKKGAARLGTPADRAGRRAKRNERANERRVSTGPVPASALIEGEDDARRRGRGPRRSSRGGARVSVAPTRKAFAEIEPPITVRGLSEAIGVKANDLIKKMMTGFNQFLNINASLDDEAAMMLALEFGVELKVVHERTAEDELLDALAPAEDDSPEGQVLRPPIVTILGHVDHGKTSLLDRIRKSNVVQSESGGITQHIGAYQVERDGKKVTFVDTPGHEAFTAMRARGANVTDIVVLVVAADDGVMPQTQEAIAHAKAADVPIVVALNKIDLPNVNLNKLYGELSQQDLLPVEYGGQTEVIKTSALTGAGIDDLLETLALVAELRELKANPARPATGTCLEASISEGRGVIATVLVQDGTLRVGDVMVCGDGFGRVRAMFDDQGRAVTEAGPSTPVEVSGLDAVPTAGEKFGVIDDITRAREIAQTRRTRTRGVSLGERHGVTLENLYSKMAEQKVKSLNLILKADVQGSLEALIKELEKLENPEVPIRILMKAVGGISESDVLLADATEAIIVGFRVAPEDRAVALADEKKIDIRRYDIIYQVTDEVKKAIEGMLVPEIKEVHLGRAQVRQVFRISKVGIVAGCFVTQGTIERGAKARIIRDGREIYKGTVDALKRFKDDVREVRENFECGIKVSNYEDLKPDDTIEAYRVDVIRRTL